jgi:Putative Flp pilus-assembly TadE/G-like
MEGKAGRTRCSAESGQTTILVILVLGLVLLGGLGLAIDFSNAHYHRQWAQAAADSACVAGAMDLLVNAQGNNLGGFPAGSPPAQFTCADAPTSAVCQYAQLNGYDGSGRVAGRASSDVLITFPGAVTGVTTPPASLAPTPFIRVNVLDRMSLGFAGLLMGRTSMDVAATATCGLQQANSPVPIIVLNPSCAHAFEVSGSATIGIVGGPPRSIQVNSNDTSCAAASKSSGCSGSGTIDLSKAGPNFSGGDFGVFGGPKAAPANFTGNHWGTASPIQDPYATLNAPAVPPLSLTNVTPLPVLYNVDGCPDHGGCVEYQPGLYTNPIVVKDKTAIFKPGLYYMKPNTPDNVNCGSPSSCTTSPTGQCHSSLTVDSNGVIRPTTPFSGGAMFYFSGTGAGNYGSAFFGANAGNPGGRTIDAFQTSNAICPGGATPPAQLGLPTTVNGNVLLGQCTGKGTFSGATFVNGPAETSGTVRGMIFFQDRADADPKGQASMQGGGGLVLSGNMYFHNCNSSGTGTSCSDPSAGYNAFVQLQGNPGSAAYVLGNITTDELVVSGNGGVKMLLNPNSVINVLKATMLE